MRTSSKYGSDQSYELLYRWFTVVYSVLQRWYKITDTRIKLSGIQKYTRFLEIQNVYLPCGKTVPTRTTRTCLSLVILGVKKFWFTCLLEQE